MHSRLIPAVHNFGGFMATTIGSANGIVRDLDWVQHSFMLAGERVELSKDLVRYRNLSSADFKYTATGFGESIILNPAPQFTPFADIRRAGLWSGAGGNVKTKEGKSAYFVGMGQAYSEMIDDNRQVVHIRFGVTQYKGLITFFTGFYDNQSAILARQGRTSLAYYFGLLTTSLATLWLQPIILVGQGLNFILGRTSSRYMDLKPTMPLYWERVQVILNSMGANLGVIPRFLGNTGMTGSGKESYKTSDDKGAWYNGTGGVKDIEELQLDEKETDYRGYMHRLMPDIFEADGTLEVAKAMQGGARRQIEWNSRVTNLTTALGTTNSKETFNAVVDYLSRPITSTPGMKMVDYLQSYHKSVVGDLAKRALDGDNVGSVIENAVNSGDKAKLEELSKAAGTESSTGEDGSATGTAVADATGQETATNPENTSSFTAATSGTVKTPASETQASQTPAEPVASEGEVTGIDEAGLKNEVFKPREKEMLTVTRTVADSKLTDEETAAMQKSISEGTAFDGVDKVYKVVTGWLSEAKDSFEIEWKNGSAFLNLGVNYTGAGSMSVQNATKETLISGTLKGVSSTSRDSRISMSDFKTGFGFIDGALQMVGDVFSGALDAVSMSGLMALAGNAFIDFPKQWDDSTATVPTANFTIELRSFSGNVIADYLYLYSVVACLLAGASPLSTGPQSYTAPFVCEAYCQGHFAIRYGMITSLTIRHGVGNLGFSARTRRPLAFDIDVEIADLSSVYHAPISNGMSPINVFKRVFDDDNIFNDYVSTITGLQLEDMVNPKRKLAIRFATQMRNVKSWWSPTHVAQRVAGTDTVQVLNKLFGPTTYAGT